MRSNSRNPTGKNLSGEVDWVTRPAYVKDVGHGIYDQNLMIRGISGDTEQIFMGIRTLTAM